MFIYYVNRRTPVKKSAGKSVKMQEKKEKDFEKVLKEALTNAQDREMERWNSFAEMPESFSFRHKRNMNRLFRAQLGSRYLPYPEAARLKSCLKNLLFCRSRCKSKKRTKRRK